MRTVAIVLVLVLLLGVSFGCQIMTPEQQAEADAAQATFKAATATLAQAEKRLAEFVSEYELIKGKIDAGESIPAVLVARFSELQGLIVGATGDARAAVAAFNAAKEANAQAAAAGVAWYNRVPWLDVGKVALGILAGVAGIWFPIAVPAIQTAQSAVRTAQTVVTAVGAVHKHDPQAGQMVKDAVLDVSRKLGVEAKVDALVQKYDPPVTAPVAEEPNA